VARPPVSVIVPFHGDEAAASAAMRALRAIELRSGDELLVADNTEHGVLAAHVAEGFATRAKRQPYSARNEAAARATGEWLLFTDADCRPRPNLIDAYFDPPPGERAGALAGEIVAAGRGGTLAQRYGADRRLLSSELFLAHPYKPMGVTANLLVRRTAFEAVGGFAEGIRSGGDADLCWRLQDAGWTIEHRPRAIVAHEHRATIRALLRQAARTAAGTRWLEARHPGFHANAGSGRRAARARRNRRLAAARQAGAGGVQGDRAARDRDRASRADGRQPAPLTLEAKRSLRYPRDAAPATLRPKSSP
jgi:GT2 family glycosyltransferase